MAEPLRRDDHCHLSRRVDGAWHSWRFDGDDAYVECVFCGEYRDALTGRVITPGRKTTTTDESEDA